MNLLGENLLGENCRSMLLLGEDLLRSLLFGERPLSRLLERERLWEVEVQSYCGDQELERDLTKKFIRVLTRYLDKQKYFLKGMATLLKNSLERFRHRLIVSNYFYK